MKQKGFTLIELLVVISIISLLASVVLVALQGARVKARDAKRLADLKQIQTALESYASDNGGYYPTTGSMSNVYVDMGCPQSETSPDMKLDAWIPGLVPNYMTTLPKDPSPINGGCYMYSSNGIKYLLTAYGTVEASSNGGTMDSDFGYRELQYMNAPSCYYSTSYPTIDKAHRKSFTITNLTTSDFSICPKIGP